MREAYAAGRGAGSGRLLLGVAGVGLGLVGVWQFAAHVPLSGWVRVLVWLVAGVVVHDGLLAPLGVVSGWLVARRTPTPVRSAVRIAGLATLTVVLLLVPLLATGGLRH
ncbi:uncharacterized protein (DUF983 family) [Phycicoccus badiiscoriae]|uniref:Uncharacterized protein (DUF983 family) n=1 Tax=Pedococcus badiiscoriae TaxID=642776 RepID=A0A852WFB9_9MICO|nr:hypothetical protein [Pedococcus badiiscoriae]NYG07923.1 uncharacterized protein (DUF983 family) [Pedococcus badiiscoriae]